MSNIKRHYIWIGLILAFLLRIGFSLNSDVLVFGDAIDYNSAAIQILKTHTYPLKGELLFFRPPFYPLFLTILYKISFQNFLLVKVVQAIIGTLSCYIIMLIGEDVFNRLTGQIAFILAAVNPFFIHWTGFLQTESLFLFLFVSSIWFLLVFDRTNLKRYLLLSSFLLALATLTRTTGLLFVPFLSLWFFLRTRKSFKNAIKNFFIFIICFFSVVAPWTIRNYRVYKSFILVNNVQGPAFWAGNNEMLLKIVSAKTKEEYRRYNREFCEYYSNLNREIKDFSNQEMQKRYFRMAFNFIRNNPEAWLRLRWKKFLSFWRPYLNPYAYSKKMSILSFVYLFPIMFLGLLGFIREFWIKKVYFSYILLIFIIIVVGSSQTLISTAPLRYRMSIIDPFLIIFTSGVIVDLFSRLKSKTF